MTAPGMSAYSFQYCDNTEGERREENSSTSSDAYNQAMDEVIAQTNYAYGESDGEYVGGERGRRRGGNSLKYAQGASDGGYCPDNNYV
jgi:hypothetical protein